MNVRPDIEEFVASLEVFSKRKLNYPTEIGEILQIAFQTGLINEFEELVFHAKFLTRAQDVMKRKDLKSFQRNFNWAYKGQRMY